jgi:hypothetical protein
MEIAITVQAYKAAKEEMGDKLPTLFTSKKKPGDELTLPIYDLGLEDLTVLAKHLKKCNDESAPKIAKLVKLLKDPDNKPVTDLIELPKVLTAFLKKQDAKTLQSLHANLKGVAYLPLSVTYTPARPETRQYSGRDAYVTFEYAFNSRHGYNTETTTFHESDCDGTIIEILRRANLMSPDETMVEDYERIKQRYLKFSEMHGEMFEVKGEAFATGGRRWWGETEVDLTVFGKPSKAVLDTEHGVDRYNRNYAKNTTYSVIYGANCAVPIHPVLPLFSLLHHKMVWVNVGKMRQYSYDKQVGNRLILPASHRRLVKALVSNLDALRDEDSGEDKSKILKAKASSSIILCYGPPGTGKTLTAEVYAETIERPLYEVQAAQIGSSAEDIETNLRVILSRSLRLKMPLLINEADAFVGKRGKTLELDQIVAVFLRLLEFHTGLVFLTTNRDQDIDDAIKSRCIAMIKYGIPEYKERIALWRVQLDQFNVELDKKELIKAAWAFPTIVGRDIQNLIKLTNRVCHSMGTTFCFEELRQNATFRGIDVLSDEQIAEAKAKVAAEDLP